MNDIFSECKSLKNVDLSSFNTLKITDMSRMFSDCKNLISIDLSLFNTHNVALII